MSQVCSIFSQLLKLFPRAEFEQAVRQHRGERHARGFTCWGQFVAMLFCQLGRAQSLYARSAAAWRPAIGKLRHLGLSAAPPRSTLAYANRQRPWQIYETVFQQLLAKCRVAAPGHKFRFKNKLLSLDASVIDLCASLFDWAQFRRTKGAVKLHRVRRPRRLFAQLLRRHRRQDARPGAVPARCCSTPARSWSSTAVTTTTIGSPS